MIIQYHEHYTDELKLCKGLQNKTQPALGNLESKLKGPCMQIVKFS